MFLGIDNGICDAETCLRTIKVKKCSSAVSLNMTYAEELYLLPEELRKLFRKYERINKKLINNKWSIEFNSLCLKENIYIYVKQGNGIRT